MNAQPLAREARLVLKPRVVVPGVVSLLFLLAMLTFFVATRLKLASQGPVFVLALLFLVLGTGFYVAAGLRFAKGKGDLLALESELVLPRRRFFHVRTHRVPWSAIEFAALAGTGRTQMLVVHAAGAQHRTPAMWLSSPELAAPFLEEVHRRMALAGNAARVAQARLEATRGNEILARRPPAALSLAAVYLLVCLAELATGTTDTAGHPSRLLRWGANAGTLVRAGEISRVVTANFLHVGLIHLVVNLMSFLVVGIALERLVGSARFLLVVLVSGVTGALASALFGRAMESVGASTAIFGIFGALLVVQTVADVPFFFRTNARSWLATLAVNVALPLLLPVIDWVGHVGGFAGGVLVALSFVRRRQPIAPAGRGARIAVGVAFAVSLVAVAQAFVAARSVDLRARFLEAEAKEPRHPGRGVTPFVAEVAEDRAATDREMAAAVSLARGSMEEWTSTTRPAALHAAALLEHRVGRDDTAVRLEAPLVPSDPIAPARVAIYARKIALPVVSPPFSPDSVVNARVVPDASGFAVAVDVAPSAPRPVHLLLAMGDAADPAQAVSLADVCLTSGEPSPHVPGLTADARSWLRPVLVDGTCPPHKGDHEVFSTAPTGTANLPRGM